MERIPHIENIDPSVSAGRVSSSKRSARSHIYGYLPVGTVIVKYGMAFAILFLILACTRALHDPQRVFRKEIRRLAGLSSNCGEPVEAAVAEGETMSQGSDRPSEGTIEESPAEYTSVEVDAAEAQEGGDGEGGGGDAAVETEESAALSPKERKIFLRELPRMNREMQRRLSRQTELENVNQDCRREISMEIERTAEEVEALKRRASSRSPFVSRELAFLVEDAATVANLIAEFFNSAPSEAEVAGSVQPESEALAKAALAAWDIFEESKKDLVPEVGAPVSAETVKLLSKAAKLLLRAGKGLRRASPEMAGLADLVVVALLDWIDVAERPAQSVAESKIDTVTILLESAARKSLEKAGELRASLKGGSLMEAVRLEEQAKSISNAAMLVKQAKESITRRRFVASAQKAVASFYAMSQIVNYTRLPEDRVETIATHAARQVLVEAVEQLKIIVIKRKAIGLEAEESGGHSSDEDEQRRPSGGALGETEHDADSDISDEDMEEFRRQVLNKGKVWADARGSDNPFGAEARREIQLVEQALSSAGHEEMQKTDTSGEDVYRGYVEEEIRRATKVVKKTNQEAVRQNASLKRQLLDTLRRTKTHAENLLRDERLVAGKGKLETTQDIAAGAAAAQIIQQLQKASKTLLQAIQELNQGILTTNTAKEILTAGKQISKSAKRADSALRVEATECLNACAALNRQTLTILRVRRTKVENDLETATVVLDMVRKAVSDAIKNKQLEEEEFSYFLTQIGLASRRINRSANKILDGDGHASSREVVAALKRLRKATSRLSYNNHWGILLGVNAARKVLAGVFTQLRDATIGSPSALTEENEESEVIA